MTLPPLPQLSVVIVAQDEADRLGAALASVAFAGERIVVDGGSRDDTVAVARAAGAQVIEEPWRGFVAQKNFAWQRATRPWVLSLDADEALSPPLAHALHAALSAPSPRDPSGYRFARCSTYLGTPLRHGRWYPDARVRLAQRARAVWRGEDPHDLLAVDGLVLDLPGDLLHTPYRSLGEHLATIDRYTARAAALARARGVTASPLDLFGRPAWHFLRAYLLEQGFRDGLPGLVAASLGATTTLLKWARIAGFEARG